MSHLIRTVVAGVASLDGHDPRTGHGDPDPVLAPAVRLAAEAGAEPHAVHPFEVPAEMAMASSREAVEASSAAEASLAAG